MSKPHSELVKLAFYFVVEGFNPTDACRIAGIARSTLYRYQPYQQFKQKWSK